MGRKRVPLDKLVPTISKACKNAKVPSDHNFCYVLACVCKCHNPKPKG